MGNSAGLKIQRGSCTSAGLQIQRGRIYVSTCEVSDHEMEYTHDDHHNKTN